MKWISVVILLVALSMVNASPFHIYKRDILHKRAVALEPCKEPSKIPLEGSVDPDPAPGAPAKAKLTYTTTEEGKVVLLTVIASTGDDATAKTTTAKLCESGLTCPVPAGKEVSIETTNDVPADFKAPFTLTYIVHDEAKVIACGVANAKAAEGGAAPKDAPKADEPKADEPKADEPKADEPKADEPKGGDAPEDEPKGGGPPPPEDGGDDPPPPEDEPKGGPPPEDEEPPKRR